MPVRRKSLCSGIPVHRRHHGAVKQLDASNIRSIYHFPVRHRTSKSRHRASALLEYGDDIGASLRQSRIAFMSNL
jgi:hypothetical protein